MTTYRLASSPAVHTPGLVAWAQNDPCPETLGILTTAWPTVPHEALAALIRQEVVQRLDGDTVVFDAYVPTAPALETEEEYWEALECMPPARFQHVNGVELFHICEHLTDNLVNWHANYNGRYFQWNDAADANAVALAGRVRIAA